MLCKAISVSPSSLISKSIGTQGYIISFDKIREASENTQPNLTLLEDSTAHCHNSQE